MFKRLWCDILALFIGSKEARWERLDRLAETNPKKYQRELEKLSMEELDDYVDSAFNDTVEREKYGWGDIDPETARGMQNNNRRGIVVEFARRPGKATAFKNAEVTPEMKKAMEESFPNDFVDIIDPNYHWTPGQEHSEPARNATKSRHQRPGVFERQAFDKNRKERRKENAVARRQRSQNAGKDNV